MKSSPLAVSDLTQFYRTEQRLYCRCPSCDEVFRLCDAKVTYSAQPPRDALAKMKAERERLLDRLSELEDDLAAAQERRESDLFDQRCRFDEKQDAEVDRRLRKERKEIRRDANNRARGTLLGRSIERFAPMLPGFGHDPADVRPLFQPIDYVAFDGLSAGEVTEISFIEFKFRGGSLSPLQASIRSAVREKRVRFEERRISNGAYRALLANRMTENVGPLVSVK